MAETNENLLEQLDLNEEVEYKESTKSNQSNKIGYKDRKIDNRLKKCEAMIKKDENINRLNDDSQFLFVGNCGLDNNISYDFLEETFSKYGKVVDIIMQPKRSYSFVIFEDKNSTNIAIQDLQSKTITCNQSPICFYLFPVNKVPDSSVNTNEYEEISDLPSGLVYIENYVNDEYASKIIDYVTKSDDNQTELNNNSIIDLKKRKVKHYGYEFRYGSNDCDENNPLTDPEKQMPQVCNDLIEKMIKDGLIQVKPDQLTVNIYEAGHGIGPHIDNVNGFEDYIISLSLESSVIMEFRQKETKKFKKIYLNPNSLIVMKGDSRYIWSHSIPERKHDLVKDPNGHTIVAKRSRRVSLTFRKVKPKTISDNQEKAIKSKDEPDLILPSNDTEADNFEKSYVHNIYNEIADHFSSTRYSAWPGVTKFINSMNAYSSMLDVGCGNGKYLNLRKDMFCFGCDYSDQLIRICYERNFNCFVSDCLKIPCNSDFFDYVICIAVLHHLSTPERRIKAINEMNRILKVGGRALITVWAKEQKYKDKESIYISKKSSTNKKNPENEEKPDTNIHKFGKEFEKKDLFVSWSLKKNNKPKSKEKNNSESADTDSKQSNPDINEENKVYLRFYHVFENNELEGLFTSIPNTKIVESYYEQGNWCVIFEKTSS